ncbi:Thioredoxin family protein [Cryptosporidium meleagridis]|uniref:protein disulfide-isomerase n=1 Tax=Cryptosporidium meleagridis TaxID=93969 RepID=A0A2P4YZJ3_9CRYT|nr:Thioredoxin family protein [Cryptosporidium meleagridis]
MWGLNNINHSTTSFITIYTTLLFFLLLLFETKYVISDNTSGLNDTLNSNTKFVNLGSDKSNKDNTEDLIPFIESHFTSAQGIYLEEVNDNNRHANENFTNKIFELVTIQTDESFENLLANNDYLIILFTAPWCGMCKRAINQIHEMVKYFEHSNDSSIEHPNRFFYSKKLSIGLVNVPEFPNLSMKLNVSDYPTIKLVKKEENKKLKIIDFYGNIYHKKVISWIIQQISRLENKPKSQLIQLSTIDHIKFFLEISGYSAIYLHEFESQNKYNNTEYLLVVDICKIYDDVIFAEANYNDIKKNLSTNKDILDKNEFQFNITDIIESNDKKSKIFLFNSGKHVKTINGPFKEEALILNTIDYYKQENIIFLNKDTIGNLIDNGGTILLLIFSGNSENYIEELNKESSIIYQFYNILQRVIAIRNEKADKSNRYLEEKPLFVMSGNEGPINRRFMDFLHIDDDLLPSIIMINDLNVSPPKKYHLDLPKIYLNNLESNAGIGGISNSNNNAEILSIGKPNESNWIILNNHTSINFSPNIISDFIDEVRSGMVNITYHSQVTPSKQNGPVFVLVGNTFKEIVYDSTRDVLVLFYTPWCGHCKTFDPIYNEVANIVKSKTNVLVAKIDMSANFIPDDQIGRKIFRFPTIKLYKKREKANPIDFDGEREVNSILDFIWIHTARDEL